MPLLKATLLALRLSLPLGSANLARIVKWWHQPTRWMTLWTHGILSRFRPITGWISWSKITTNLFRIAELSLHINLVDFNLIGLTQADIDPLNLLFWINNLERSAVILFDIWPTRSSICTEVSLWLSSLSLYEILIAQCLVREKRCDLLAGLPTTVHCTLIVLELNFEFVDDFEDAGAMSRHHH